MTRTGTPAAAGGRHSRGEVSTVHAADIAELPCCASLLLASTSNIFLQSPVLEVPAAAADVAAPHPVLQLPSYIPWTVALP
jgi:hypothetical protein